MGAQSLRETQLVFRNLPNDAGGNGFGTAYQLGTLDQAVSLNGWVGAWDPCDVVQFELTDPSDLSVQLSSLSSDIDLYLFDSATKLIARSIRGGNQGESISAELAAGTYYVLVAPYRHAASAYQLTLAAEPQEESTPDAAGNRFSDAYDLGTLQNDLILSDYVGQNDWADFYAFETTEPLDIDVSLQTAEGTVGLYVFDTQRQLVDFGFTGDGTDHVTISLGAGSYFAVVVAAGGTVQTGYNLRFDLNETPPSESLPIPSTPFPDVAYFGDESDWNLNAVSAPEVWAQGYTGDGVVVAIVDTGIDLDHSDLADNIWINDDEILGDGIDNDANGFIDDVYGWDFASNDNMPADSNGHGTHVAGTIVAANNGYGATGVAYEATVMAVQVLGADGSGSSSDVADGIYYAVDNGADIINLSLGGGFSNIIYAALQYAATHSVLVVAAAGNDGESSPNYPAIHSAQLTNVLSVGAFSQSDEIANFSNLVGSSGAVQVDAPGVQIYSTYLGGHYAVLSGTSMAAAHVSGMAALALSANPSLTAAELRQVLIDGATRLIAGSDSEGGINGAAIVPAALAADTATVTTTSSRGTMVHSGVSASISTAGTLEGALALRFDVVDAIFAENTLPPWLDSGRLLYPLVA
ncbi:MAG: S8 family serine peptidase [Pirellulales bacterium]|nr:S8 family serine peptidase [Pirellulales bacterium]